MATYDEELAEWLELSPQEQRETPRPVYGSTKVSQVGREMALGGVPLQVGSLLAALAQLQARAAGSPGEILPTVLTQLGQLRQQYTDASQAINRRLGYGGGGQGRREQAKLLGHAGQQYGQLFAGEQLTALANLLSAQAAFQPGVSGAARPPLVSVKDMPFNAAPYGAGLASMLSTARTIRDYYANQPTTTPVFQPPTAMAPTTPPVYGPAFFQ